METYFGDTKTTWSRIGKYKLATWNARIMAVAILTSILLGSLLFFLAGYIRVLAAEQDYRSSLHNVIMANLH